jgi:hypothetical protein
MGEGTPLYRRLIVVRIGIALAQGVLLWVLYEAAVHELWPQSRRGLLLGLVCIAVVVPLAHYLLADLATRARQLAVLVALALLTFGLGWHHGTWTYFEEHGDFYSFPFALGVLLFHALPFVQSALTRGSWRPRYEELFHFAWRNTLLGALGGLFAGVFWLLLGLWAALFHMLGIDFFKHLFTSSPFAITATTVAIGVGVQLAGSVERLQAALRQQLLALLKWLAPLAILILVLFTVALVAKSPELFAEHRRAISAAWLLWLVALTVALVNAAYQDGREEAPYPRWLGFAMRHAVVLLLPVALLAIYALGVRIDSYGMTVARAWGILVALIALAYASGYAWAGLRKGAWMAGIGAVNVGVALGTIAMLTLMLTPLLAPERLAAESQYRRAVADADGDDDDNDAYAYLRFDSGKYGRERLADLAVIEGHPQAENIRKRAAAQLVRKRPWDPSRPARELTVNLFQVFPAGATLDPALLAALRKARGSPVSSWCFADSPCPLLLADLNRDGLPEAIVFLGQGIIGAAPTPRGWQMLDHVQRLGASGRHNDVPAVQSALERGDYRIGELPWQAIEINGEYFVLMEPRHRDPACARPDETTSAAPLRRPACP